VEENECVKQEYTLTLGGEDKWLRPVSAVNASSVPRGWEEVRSVLFSQSLLQLYLYVGGWYNQMGIDALDQPRMCLGMTEPSRIAYIY
jgi:hypothetical protein